MASKLMESGGKSKRKSLSSFRERVSDQSDRPTSPRTSSLERTSDQSD